MAHCAPLDEDQTMAVTKAVGVWLGQLRLEGVIDPKSFDKLVNPDHWKPLYPLITIACMGLLADDVEALREAFSQKKGIKTKSDSKEIT